MGTITIKLPEETLKVKIKGDTPTVKEKFAIGKLIRSTQTGKQTEKNILKKSKAKDEQLFDRTSGIKNAKLRMALSGMEKDSEKELTLNKFGLDKSDYTQDDRGQFALTPSGASKFGMETDKNVIIDEQGFSRYDFADMAGIIPEVGGAVAGGLKGAATGAAVGSAVPIIGTGIGALVGGMVGAGGGAAAGSLAEEAIEGMAGVSDQSAKEILKDAGREAAWAAGGELAFGLPYLAFKSLAPGAKSLVAEGGEKLQIAGKADELGFQLSKAQMGLGPIPARIESLMEKIIGSSPRTKANYTAMKSQVDELNRLIKEADAADPREAGELFMNMASKGGKKYRKKRDAAIKSLQKNIQDSADILSQGLRTNSTLGDDLFKQLNETFKTFDDLSSTQFTNINNLIRSATGSDNIIPTTGIDEAADNLAAQYNLVKKTDRNGNFQSYVTSGIVDDQTTAALYLANKLKQVGVTGADGSVGMSFATAYSQRKVLTNIRLGLADVKVPGLGDKSLKEVIDNSSPLTKNLKEINKAFDDALDINNIDGLVDNLVKSKQLTQKQADALKLASQELPAARKSYFDGMKKFGEIESTIGMKNLVATLRTGKKPKDFESLVIKSIKDNNPDALINLGKALNNSGAFKSIKQDMSNVWLRNNLINSGFDSINPNKFNPGKFSEAVQNLGTTGDELFGVDNFAKIKSFASQFENLNLANVTKDMIDGAFQKGFTKDFVKNLERVYKSSKNYSDTVNRNLFKKLRAGDLTSDEAVTLVNSNATKIYDLKKIMKFYKNDPNAIQKIQGNYLQDMLDGVGVTLNAKTMNQLGDRILKADGKSGGKLATIFGKDRAEGMKDFAKVIKLIASDTPAGDLVAGNIATNFMNNIGKIARITILGQMLSGKRAQQQIKDAYRATKGLPPEKRAGILGSVLNGLLRQAATQQTQEVRDETESQVRAMIKNSPQVQKQAQNISNQLSNLQQTASQPSPASSLSQVNVGQPSQSAGNINPIVVTNPVTRATFGSQ